MTDNIKKCFSPSTTIIGLLSIIIILLIFNYINKDGFTEIISPVTPMQSNNVENNTTIQSNNVDTNPQNIYKEIIAIREQLDPIEKDIKQLQYNISTNKSLIELNTNLITPINNRIISNTNKFKNEQFNTSLEKIINADTQSYVNLTNQITNTHQIIISYENALTAKLQLQKQLQIRLKLLQEKLEKSTK
jgi:septal ring-binding cell division protein DamX